MWKLPGRQSEVRAQRLLRCKRPAPRLAATATEIATTFKQHNADLLREATQLGNEPALSVTPKVDPAKVVIEDKSVGMFPRIANAQP